MDATVFNLVALVWASWVIYWTIDAYRKFQAEVPALIPNPPHSLRTAGAGR